MAGAEAKASLVAAPILSGRADTTGDDWREGVASQANTGASQSLAIPAKMRGLFASIRVTGASADIGFSKGTSAGTVALTATGTLAAPNAQTGYPIPQDGSIDVQIPPDATFLVWMSSAAAGYLKIYISEVLALSK